VKPAAIAADLQMVARLLEVVVLVLDDLTDQLLASERPAKAPRVKRGQK